MIQLKSVRIPLLCLSVLLFGLKASAYYSNDVATITSGYSNAFYFVSGTNGYFRDRQGSGNATYFWQMANEIDSVIDAYEWTSNTVYLGMITNLLNGFIRPDQGRHRNLAAADLADDVGKDAERRDHLQWPALRPGRLREERAEQQSADAESCRSPHWFSIPDRQHRAGSMACSRKRMITVLYYNTCLYRREKLMSLIAGPGASVSCHGDDSGDGFEAGLLADDGIGAGRDPAEDEVTALVRRGASNDPPLRRLRRSCATPGGRVAQHVEADAAGGVAVPRRQSRPVAAFLALSRPAAQGPHARHCDAAHRRAAATAVSKALSTASCRERSFIASTLENPRSPAISVNRACASRPATG